MEHRKTENSARLLPAAAMLVAMVSLTKLLSSFYSHIVQSIFKLSGDDTSKLSLFTTGSSITGFAVGSGIAYSLTVENPKKLARNFSDNLDGEKINGLAESLRNLKNKWVYQSGYKDSRFIDEALSEIQDTGTISSESLKKLYKFYIGELRVPDYLVDEKGDQFLSQKKQYASALNEFGKALEFPFNNSHVGRALLAGAGTWLTFTLAPTVAMVSNNKIKNNPSPERNVPVEVQAIENKPSNDIITENWRQSGQTPQVEKDVSKQR